MSDTERLKTALKRIRAIAWSDAAAEELEDAQGDLRNIYFLADEALSENSDNPLLRPLTDHRRF